MQDTKNNNISTFILGLRHLLIEYRNELNIYLKYFMHIA